jgi:hypothetical protein
MPPRPALDGGTLPPHPMEHRRIEEGPRQAEGVRQRLRISQHLLEPRQGLVWIAQMPQRPGHIAQAYHPDIRCARGEDSGAVLLGRPEGDRLGQMRLGRGRLPQEIRAHPQGKVGFHRTLWK